MAYLGGKAKGAEFILNILNDKRFDGLPYVEPFVGYAHVLRRVVRKASYAAYDANPLVIALHKGIQEGRRYPRVSKSKYDAMRRARCTQFECAVAAFAYSFSGKEWGGYAPVDGRGFDNSEARKRYYDRLAANETFRRTRFRTSDYRALRPRGALVYCDPPYAGTTGYSSGVSHDEFWETMREWSKDNVVLVSEYKAPRDFVCVASARKRSFISRGEERRECLFAHRSQRDLFR